MFSLTRSITEPGNEAVQVTDELANSKPLKPRDALIMKLFSNPKNPPPITGEASMNQVIDMGSNKL